MIRKILSVGLVLIAVGCRNQQCSDKSDSVISFRESVVNIPDSVATAEQLVLKKKIENLICTKIQVENNRLNLAVGKDYFTARDIPSGYYYWIVEELEQTNTVIDKWEAEGTDMNLQTAVEDTRTQYREYIEAVGPDGISFGEFSRRKFQENLSLN